MMRFADVDLAYSALLFAFAPLVACSCSKTWPSSDQPAAVQQAPATLDRSAGKYDWENSQAATPVDDPAEYDPVSPSDITSSQTLEQTTTWLHWAMLRYSNPTHKTTDVRFNGCSMQWTQRADSDGSRRVIDTTYALNLRDVDIRHNSVLPFLRSVRLTTHGNTTVTERVYEFIDGKPTPAGERTQSVATADIPFDHRDHIERRVSWALIHAAKLCGAKTSP